MLVFRNCLITALAALSLGASAFGQDGVRSLPSPDEVFQAVEESDLLYILEDLDSTEAAEIREARPTTSPHYYRITNDDGTWSLTEFRLPEEQQAMLAVAEAAYESDNHQVAISAYRDILESNPDFHKSVTYIGNCFYGMGQLDSALYYFKDAIHRNFIDYQAHWFLADTYWNMGDSARAVDEITTAHLLNVNHPGIKGSLLHFRSAVGRPCTDRGIDPVFYLERNGRENNSDSIIVRANFDWIFYALTRALWRFEPDYAPGDYRPDSAIPDSDEYRQALLVWAQWVKNYQLVDSSYTQFPGVFEWLVEMGNQSQFDYLIWYCLIARERPEIMSVIDSTSFEGIKALIDTHL